MIHAGEVNIKKGTQMMDVIIMRPRDTKSAKMMIPR